jgi:hypothetical protein
MAATLASNQQRHGAWWVSPLPQDGMAPLCQELPGEPAVGEQAPPSYSVLAAMIGRCVDQALDTSNKGVVNLEAVPPSRKRPRPFPHDHHGATRQRRRSSLAPCGVAANVARDETNPFMACQDWCVDDDVSPEDIWQHYQELDWMESCIHEQSEELNVPFPAPACHDWPEDDIVDLTEHSGDAMIIASVSSEDMEDQNSLSSEEIFEHYQDVDLAESGNEESEPRNNVSNRGDTSRPNRWPEDDISPEDIVEHYQDMDDLELYNGTRNLIASDGNMDRRSQLSEDVSPEHHQLMADAQCAVDTMINRIEDSHESLNMPNQGNHVGMVPCHDDVSPEEIFQHYQEVDEALLGHDGLATLPRNPYAHSGRGEPNLGYPWNPSALCDAKKGWMSSLAAPQTVPVISQMDVTTCNARSTLGEHPHQDLAAGAYSDVIVLAAQTPGRLIRERCRVAQQQGEVIELD